MYVVSQAVKDAIMSNDRIVDAKIEINGVSFGTENIESFTYEDISNVETFLMVGSVAAAKVDVSLLDVSGVNLESAEYKVYAGIEVSGSMTYIPLGVFYADVDSIKRKKNNVSLTLYDGMMKAQREYVSSLSYPANINAVMNEVASAMGVQFVGALPNYTIPTKPDGYSCRGIIGLIAQLCGGFAKFTRDGKLTIKNYTSVSFTIDGGSYIGDAEKKRESLYKINKVVGIVPTDEESDVIEYSAGVGNVVMTIENPYITQAIVNDIYNRYKNFEYIPLFLEMQGNPLLDTGDIITVETVEEESLLMPIMRNTLSFAGGYVGQIESMGETESAGFNLAGSIGERLDALEENMWKYVLVNIISTSGTVFKNGIGSTELTAKTFLNGIEVDLNGTRYEYRWHKFDKNGNLVVGATQYTKSITVNANAIDEKVTYKLEVILNGEVLSLQEITLTNVYDGETGPQGPQGPQGDDGKGVQSITVQYYVSTSDTTQTGGEWSDTKPAYQENKYLWIRYKIVYKNPTSEEYTQAVLDDGWQAVKVANEAKQEAQNAMTSADGKNTVFRQSSTPPTTNRKIGDLWFKTNEGNKMYVWTGSWTETKLDYQALSVGKLSAISADLGTVTAGHIQGVTLNLANGKVVVDSSGNAVFKGIVEGASGVFGEVTVNEGDITIKDANSNTEALLTPLPNLLGDPGFEGVLYGPEDMTYNWADFVNPAFAPYDWNIHKPYWLKSRNPKVAIKADMGPSDYRALPIFGEKAVVVNGTNYVYQDVADGLGVGGTYTLSGYFRKQWGQNPGKPGIVVAHRRNTSTVSGLANVTFNTVPINYDIVRYAITFTIPTTYDATSDYIRVQISGADNNWVQVDGVQLVKSSLPTVYNPDYDGLKVTEWGNQATIWTGFAYPNEVSTITPKIPLSQCKFGWLLKWQAYRAGTGLQDSDYQYSIIPKSQIYQHSGKGMDFSLTRSTAKINKYLYVTDANMTGHTINGTGDNALLVLSEVLAI